jgi:Regulator of ribonuclease activity B
MPARLNKGEIARVRSRDGFVYLQYLGTHPKRGQAVAVCSKRQPRSVKVTAALFEGAQVVFYPLSADVGRGVATIVGRLPQKLTVPRSAAESWDHDLLLSRVAVVDVALSERSEVPATAPASELCTVTHYVYCQTEGDALELSSVLNERGFQTAQEPSPVEGLPWLVLATHDVADEEALDGTRQALKSLAASCRGEYDGWQTGPGTACPVIKTHDRRAADRSDLHRA